MIDGLYMAVKIVDISYRIAFNHQADNIDELSDNLLTRLSGFIDEVERLSKEILDTAGVKNIWKDIITGKGKYTIVKSSIEQLQHLSGEFESLSTYVEKRYKDKTVSATLKKLVESISILNKSMTPTKMIFMGYDSFVEKLHERYDEIQSRIRSCRAAVQRLQNKEDQDPLADFDFGPPD